MEVAEGCDRTKVVDLLALVRCSLLLLREKVDQRQKIPDF